MSTLRYADFVDRVRRHRPSDVVAKCAAISSTLSLEDRASSGPPVFPDFALAGVARAAVLHGNEYRDRSVGDAELREMVSMFINIDEPFVSDRNLRSFLIRVGAEQFPYQGSPFWDLARTRALFVDAAKATPQAVITPSMWIDLLGCSLEAFVGVALLLHTGAARHAGRYDSHWLDLPHFRPVFESLPRDTVERVAESAFVMDHSAFRALAAEHAIADIGLERYSFNPLRIAPFLRHRHVTIAPVARAILMRATPGSLYYSAAQRQSRFTDALGLVFETYVGNQLRLCRPLALMHDVEYEPGRKAVDFIAVMPSAVLLIEAKATPLTQLSRLGGENLEHDFQRAPGKGMRQIEHTAALLRDDHPAFRSVPKDRPVLGMVVTMEPYYGFSLDDWVAGADGQVIKWLTNARELEQLVSIDSVPIDRALREHSLQDPQSGTIEPLLRRYPTGRNRILDDAWKTYPFERLRSSVSGRGSSQAP